MYKCAHAPLGHERLDDGELGGDLGAAHDGSQRALAGVQREVVQLLHHEEAAGRVLHELGHAYP